MLVSGLSIFQVKFDSPQNTVDRFLSENANLDEADVEESVFCCRVTVESVVVKHASKRR